MAASRVERLMNVVAYLSDTNVARTLREIIETVPGYPDNFSAARRAFERDKDDLRAMQFDISVENNPNGDVAYVIRNESTYFDVDLSSKQRSILEYALGLYGPEENLANSALTKLGGMNPENEVREVTPLPMPDNIGDLLKACTDSKPITIVFRGSARNVEPKRLIARGGYWYLEARDIQKNAMRTFRVDRIEELQSLDTSEVAQASSDENEEDPITRIEVGVHPQLRNVFMRTWNGIYDQEANIVHVEVTNPELFVSRIFDFAGFVCVLSPEPIKRDLNSRFDKALSQFSEAK